MMAKYARSRYKVEGSNHFELLSEDQKQEIYSASLEILERTGAMIYDEEAREILKKGGCWVDGDRVRIPVGVSEWAVRSAPSRIHLYDRNGNRKLVLQGRNTYFGPGPTNTYFRDPFTGERRRPVIGDTENVAKVCDALEHIDFVMDLGTPTGVTDTLADVHAFNALVRNTTKPIVHWGFDVEQYQDIVDMAAEVVGGMDALQRKPYVVLYSEPSSPLMHSREAIAKAVFAAKNQIPIVYTPCVISGATTPATLAGTVALGIAESMVGIVVSQLVRPGAPIIMGGVYGIMDMKTTVFSYGSPEFMLMQAAIAEMAHFMEIPVFGTAGCTDSHILDGQAGAEAAMSILMAAQSGANLVHDVGYTGSGACGSLEQLVTADEIISMVKRFMRGIEVNEDTMLIEVVEKVGPGGHYLLEESTMAHFKTEHWRPTLMSRKRYNAWVTEDNESSMGDRAREKLQSILKEHQAEPLSDGVLKKLDGILAGAETRMASKKKK
jgi:trimethylamine--corrinoid protein Co-methyltransferase